MGRTFPSSEGAERIGAAVQHVRVWPCAALLCHLQLNSKRSRSGSDASQRSASFENTRIGVRWWTPSATCTAHGQELDTY